MATYSLADVVELTGIKAPTLRKWESRYNIITPKRTETNIRYYTDTHLKVLLNVSILLRNGFRISQIDRMSVEELFEHTTQLLGNTGKHNSIQGLILAMLEFDEVSFDDILKRHALHHGLITTITELIYPFLTQIGILWITDKAMPAQEHFVSNLIKKRLFAAIDSLPPTRHDAPLLLLFLPPDENHEMGLLLAYYMARSLDWRVLYLGGNVPLDNIGEVVQQTAPQLMMTLFFTPKSLGYFNQLATFSEVHEVPLAISSPVELRDENYQNEFVIPMKTPTDFLDVLEETSRAFA